jgi:hypothetical protein
VKEPVSPDSNKTGPFFLDQELSNFGEHRIFTIESDEHALYAFGVSKRD